MRCKGLIVGAAALGATGVAAAGPVEVNYAQPTLDRWVYPFNSTPGTRIEANVFGAVLMPGFDDRDGQFLIGFDTGGEIPTGLGAENYRIISVRVRATISQGGRFVYDPTHDPVSTVYAPTNPAFTPDEDAGKPIDLFGAGYRNGWGLTNAGGLQEFCETCPFGGVPLEPPAEGARNVFAAIFDSAGTATDISRQVRLEIEATPMAVGRAATVAPGAVVPADTEFTFDVDLCAPNVRAYFQRSLNEGRINLIITSLHPLSGPGGTEYPVFYTKEHPLVATNPALAPRLELVVNRGMRADFDNSGSLNVNDFVVYQQAFAGGSPAADVNDDCALNVNDFVTFQTLFVSGR